MRTIYIGAMAALLLAASASAHAAACTRLTRDLSTGSNDSTMGGQVRQLQEFLVSAGYLSAAPNGNFGPATTAAVKAYQAAKGLPSTGFVGSLTRFAIEYQSCSSTSSSGSNASGSQATESTGSNSGSSSSKGSITRPRAGEELVMGKTFTVKWAGVPKGDYALVLEDSKGVTHGYIASYLSPSATEYVWNVGEVEVSGSNSTKRVPLDDYRIRLQSRSFGKSDSDAVSSTFRIGAPELAATTLLPTSIRADGKAVVALYGAGLFGATIYLDEWYQNPVTVVYASPDGRLLVLSVPEGTAVGKHRLVIRNQYGSLITSTIQLSVDK